jgi:peptide/nickel transport system substrate-binding protein
VCENATSADINSKPSEDYPGFKVSAPDDYTVVYEIDNPLPLFMYSGLVGYCALPEHIWKDVDLSAIDELTDVKYMMGMGPFSPTQIKVGEEITLVRNEYYWEMKPYLDGILVRIISDADSLRMALENEEVNYLAQGVNMALYNKLKDQEGYYFFVNPSGNYTYYLIDCADEITGQVEVRHALNLLANREAIMAANNNPLGKIMTSVFTSADIGFEANTANEDCYTYNPEKAKQILEDAGWKVGADGIRVKDGVRLSITQLAQSDAGAGHLIFINDCKEAGIEITVKIVDRATLYDLVFTDTPHYQIFQNGSTMGPTCDGYYTFYGKGIYNNFLRPEYKELFDKATSAPTIEEQTKIYSEISRKVSDEFPCIWLYENMRFRATSDYLNLDECNCTGYYHMWVSAAHAYFEKK